MSGFDPHLKTSARLLASRPEYCRLPREVRQLLISDVRALLDPDAPALSPGDVAVPEKEHPDG